MQSPWNRFNGQISIGDNTIIGAQSMVLKNCNKNSVYYGIPAKKIRDREDNSKYLQIIFNEDNEV